MKLDIQRMKRQKIEKKLERKGLKQRNQKEKERSLIITESFI